MQFLSQGFSHRAELMHGKESAIPPHPLLSKEHRPSGHLHLYQNGHDKHHRPQEQQAQEAPGSIENKFGNHYYGFNFPFFINFSK